MITHDVDEAILLADRVLLMTNGPNAVVAESVAIDIPRPRDRTQIIHQPAYYAIRNHLVEFLVKRSKTFRGQPPKNYDAKHPPVLRPGLDAGALAEAASLAKTASRH
jgi:nitrate/nitrite transport system ATP-binding protein